jgi:putative acetyltransferase
MRCATANFGFRVELPSGWRLRPATKQDGGAVRALIFGILREYGLQPDPAGTDSDLDDLEAAYAGRNGWFAVLVTDTGEIAGSVGLLPVGTDGVELRKMYLGRAWRGRGLGRALLAAALGEARRRGFRRVVLETASVLREAIRLYERAGFRRRPGAPHACRCDLTLELSLA